MKTTVKIIAKKHLANVLVNISPCYNYLMFYGGTDVIHAFYMDVVILKRKGEGEGGEPQESYNGEWRELHRVKEEFVGFPSHIKS
jgi:hypothetical protein